MKNCGTINEPTIFDTEFPSLDDTTLVIVDVNAGTYKFNAMTLELTDEEKKKWHEENEQKEGTISFPAFIKQIEIIAEDGTCNFVEISFGSVTRIRKLEYGSNEAITVYP